MAFDLATGKGSHGCGCFGGGHGPLSWWLALRRAAIAVSAVSLAVLIPNTGTLPIGAGAILLLGLTLGWAAFIATPRLRAAAGDRIER